MYNGCIMKDVNLWENTSIYLLTKLRTVQRQNEWKDMLKTTSQVLNPSDTYDGGCLSHPFTHCYLNTIYYHAEIIKLVPIYLFLVEAKALVIFSLSSTNHNVVLS